ncbi:hypothetical protein LZ31DRAFT_636668 [Colletotrichum somersetense]|nr:hypothetical protein LZ31DRAFT_636668 [Colletotrichum somersetense]
MRAADTVRATLESFNLFGDCSRCQTDPTLFLWKRLRNDFKTVAAEAANKNNSYSTDNEYTNHAVLTATLELDLADKLNHLDKSNAPETLHRLSANLKRLHVTKNMFVFLFDIEVAQSRVAQEALKALCIHYPGIDILKLFGAFEETSDVKQVRVCPTAWPKKKTTTANKKSAKATNSYRAANETLSDDNVDSDNDEDNSDYQLVDGFPSHSGIDDSSDEVDTSSPVLSTQSRPGCVCSKHTDASVVKPMNEIPPVRTDCQLSPFSSSDWPRDSLLLDQSLITPQEATIVDGMEIQTRTASLIDSTAWTSGACLMKCLAMITGSSEPQPGQPGWLLMDSSVTEDSRKLNNQLFRLMTQSSTNIILPLFLSKNHWALGIMRRDRPVSIEVDLYDSLSMKAHDEAARKQLDGFCGRYLSRSTRLPGYIVSIPCAQQSNGNDCGVYVIAFAAYVVAQRTVVTIDASLWRFIVQVMTDLSDPPPPSSERRAIKEYLRQSFQAEFFDHDLLASPRVPVQTPMLTSTTADVLEFEKYMALVFTCQSRFQAGMRRAVESRLPVWTSAHQQLI